VKRREFIAGLGSAAAWPIAVLAQERALPVVGYLSGLSLEDSQASLGHVRRGLTEAGYVDRRNVAIEYRYADGNNARLPALAADLVHRDVAVIVTLTTPGVLAAKTATKSTPIVFLVGTDPVDIGLVDSLNRPGANLTGVTTFSTALAAKRLELLHQLVPAATSVAHLVNPSNAAVTASETKELETAARALGLRVVTVNARNESEIEAAFETIGRENAGGLVISVDPLFNNVPDRVVALAARHQLPAVYDRHTGPAAGGLVSYGTYFPDAWRLTGVLAGRVLKGERPADLPVQQVTKVELVINLKTAKALGLTIPETLLATADEVIQ
jgi:putative tryptophan/tyrosine transport system substrate-binding protein